MARQTRGGLDFDEDGKPALDNLLLAQMNNPRVTMILMARPLPEGGKRPMEQEMPVPQPKRKKNNNPKGRRSELRSRHWGWCAARLRWWSQEELRG